jgi:uncharacterized protein YegL
MPKLNDQTMENQPNVGHFGFSAVRVDDLGASEYTLATIALDVSGSVYGFIGDIEKALKECVKALQYSPRADNLMLRVIKFESQCTEIHGFKLLENCQISDYDGCLQPGGATVLCDASVDAIEAIKNYAGQLDGKEIDVNGIVIVVTDGDDNGSSLGREAVGRAKLSCVTDEKLESMLSILVGVNIQTNCMKNYLDDFKDKGNFDQFVGLDNADAKTIAKLGQFISKSISSQSQSLGTGGPSQTINFNGSLTI